MTDDKPPSDLEKVGYGKPPKKYRFVKGKSGNRNGRPPRKFKPTLSKAAEEPTIDMILYEAYRLVRVVDGKKASKLPTIQVATRSLGIAAMKGDRLAHRNFLEVVEKSEAKKSADRIIYYDNCTKYKKYWEREFAICDAKGKPRPETFPHPDDIFINQRTGEVLIDGPMDAGEKADLDEILTILKKLKKELDMLADHRERLPGDIPDDLGMTEQRMFDEADMRVPKRYKITLKCRLPDDGSPRAPWSEREI
jgi:hypothetical protein